MRTILFLYITLCTVLSISAQDDHKKFLNLGERYYNAEQYKDAAYFYLKADSSKTITGIDANNLGFSLLNLNQRELEAIPYLEKALLVRKTDHQLIRMKLGTLYHKVFQFNKAIEHFSKYLSSAGPQDRYIIYCEKMIKTCNTANRIVKKQKEFDIKPMPYPLSQLKTKQVFITVDGATLYTQTDDNTIYKIDIVDGIYQTPTKLFIHNDFKQADLVHVSYDGQVLYFRKSNRGHLDLHQGQLIGLSVKDIKEMPSTINSKFNEYDLSVSADGTTIYFSSDRPGGYGKSDIYKTVLNNAGKWNDAENVGPQINTPFDERFPVIHPLNKQLYFASNGHDNMGGFDMFRSVLTEQSWSEPENAVFINTIYDDVSFSQTGDGNLVVFSRAKDFSPEIHHLWSVNLTQNIPLTIVKGTIKAGTPLAPVAASIKVYEQETSAHMKYVYDPNPRDGKYLLIFPPGKNYDLLVKANNHLPQLINIEVPDQTYFYELFQEIRLYEITVANKKVGEKIEISNVFYDIYKTNLTDSLINKYSPEREKNYDHLLQMVEDIIETTDSIGIENIKEKRKKPEVHDQKIQESYNHLINLIENAIATTDSVSLSLLDEQTLENDKTSDSYFYSASTQPEKFLETVVYNKDTIYTKPKIRAKKEKTKRKNEHLYDFNYRNLKDSEKRNILTKTIYFDINEVRVIPQYLFDLSQITDLIYDNHSLGVEIHGYADERGNEQYNIELSQRRANEVYKKIQSNMLKSNRIIIEGHGELKTNNTDSNKLSKSRKVDIIIFEPIINKPKVEN